MAMRFSMKSAYPLFVVKGAAIPVQRNLLSANANRRDSGEFYVSPGSQSRQVHPSTSDVWRAVRAEFLSFLPGAHTPSFEIAGSHTFFL